MRRSKWVIATYAMLLFLAVSAGLPNFLPTPIRNSLPSWATGQTVALGLDLQGGAHLLLAINRDDLENSRLQDTRETVLAEMQALGLNPATLQTEGMSLSTPMSDALMAALQSATTGTSQPGSPTDFTVTTSENTLQFTLTETGLDRAVTDAADRSLEVIRNRIDQAGVSEPLINRVGADRNRTLVLLQRRSEKSASYQFATSETKVSYRKSASGVLGR